MEVHDRWETPTFDLAPIAARTGPFPKRDLLRVWWDNRRGDDELQLVDTGEGMLPLAASQGTLRFVGEADLIDYRSPLGSGCDQALAEYLETIEAGTKLVFDSLPAEAASVLVAGLEAAGVAANPAAHSVTAVTLLPDAYADWLGSLDRKQRHEIRRKLRRFERAGGRPVPTRLEGAAAVTTFAALHRRAGGDKGAFMTEGMEEFFAALHREAGGVVDILEGPGRNLIAAAFGFEDEEGYYLYNSAYEPSAAELSPGIVLVTSLVRTAIRSGRRVFDFLKGEEMYKFRLGATARPLYRLAATLGNRP